MQDEKRSGTIDDMCNISGGLKLVENQNGNNLDYDNIREWVEERIITLTSFIKNWDQ